MSTCIIITSKHSATGFVLGILFLVLFDALDFFTFLDLHFSLFWRLVFFFVLFQILDFLNDFVGGEYVDSVFLDKRQLTVVFSALFEFQGVLVMLLFAHPSGKLSFKNNRIVH